MHLSRQNKRFLNAISGVRKSRFPNGKTYFSALRKSRSENVYSVDSDASLFQPLDQKIINFSLLGASGFEAISGTQNVEFSNGKTYFPALRKSRSENVYSVDSDASPFSLWARKSLNLTFQERADLKRFPELKMLSIPMGKLDFPHTGNRVQKTFILSTQMHYFSDFLRERQ